MSNETLKQKISPQNNKSPVGQFREFLEKGKSQLALALPKHLTADRMIRLACTEFSRNKDLQTCTQASVFGAIIQASQLGLEVGVMGQAYLIPFKNNKNGKTECQFIPGYKGLISLARRSGDVTSIETNIVYENDEFDLNLGIDTTVKHKPNIYSERGKPIVVYGVAKFKQGGHHFEWMGISEVNKIRARSKASTSGPWVTDYEQMIKKTLIRRMMNYLPMSIELSNAIQISDAADDGKTSHIDGDFVVLDQDDYELTELTEPAKPTESVDTKTGEIIDDRYTDLRLAIKECESIADIARLLQEMEPKDKKALESDIRNRQNEIKAK
jgi:recombination protein RecT